MLWNGSILEAESLPSLLNQWREDATVFLRRDVPKIALVMVVTALLIWSLRFIAGKVAALHVRRLPPGLRTQQIRTLASIVNGIGVFVIVFWAVMEILPHLGLELGPLLASAGIAGLAIGFGAQTLVHDFINGFFILLENQYDLGDIVRVAGVKGTVEAMSLRSTTLRDDDGTVHIVPNGEIKIVSNTTRDWTQLILRVAVAYGEPSDRVIKLLQEAGEEVRQDKALAGDIVGDIQVPGIERVGNGEAEYLMLVKTRPTRQDGVARELRRRIKESFQKNNVQTAGPGRVYVMQQSPAG